MKTITGDLIKLAKDGDFDVIVHGCNCFNTMGAGIAKIIAREFPQAKEADALTQKGDRAKLGNYTQATVQTDAGELTIVNGYTQYNYGRGTRQVSYSAMTNLFKSIALSFPDKKIGYPLIGAGRAGGDWDIISQIIVEALPTIDHTLVVLP